MRARARGGQARRGATALRNKQQGEKGSAAKGRRRGEEAGSKGRGRRRGPRRARGLVARDPNVSETRDGCRAELTADTERHAPSLEPCAPGSPAPHSDLARKVRKGAVCRPWSSAVRIAYQVPFGLPRFSPPSSSLVPSRVLLGTRKPWAGGRPGLGPSVIPSSTPRRGGPQSPPHPHFSLPPPLGCPRNPAPGALGEEADILPSSPGVCAAQTPAHGFPSSLQRFPEISQTLSFQNIPAPRLL